MHGVALGSERRSVAREDLQPMRGERAWAFECEGVGFVVGGSPREPHRDRLELAERVATHIHAFVMEADEYLAAFVAPEQFEARRPWEVDRFEFGCRRSDAIDEFEIFLSLEGDTYGSWRVRFKFCDAPLSRYYPVEFGRRQI